MTFATNPNTHENTPPDRQKISLIVAASTNQVIGVRGDLPWHIPQDLKRFKRLTMGHAIIMGRKTFDSIGRLLPGRTTVIVTRQTDFEFPGAIVVHSVEQALQAVAYDSNPFVTGGEEIYRLFLPYVTEVLLTRIEIEIEGDARLPALDLDNVDLWQRIETSEPDEPVHANQANQATAGNRPFTFHTYRKIGPASDRA